MIVRDLMVRSFRTFKQFRDAGEGIATNILADRLRKLEATGIIVTEPDPADGRRSIYRLTEKGIDLAPALLELLIWGAHHQAEGEDQASCAAIDAMAQHRAVILSEVHRRWAERDDRPLQATDGRWLWP